MWEPQASALKEDGYEFLTPRLYNLGRSMDEWANAILARVPQSFVLVGASMGGYAALEIARRAPERLLGLVLSGSRADADPPERRATREKALELVREGGAKALWEEMQRGPFSGTPEEVRRRLDPIAEAQTPEGLANAITAIRDRRDSQFVLSTLDVPFMIVVGDNDPLISPDEARTHATLAAGRAEIFESTGHLPSFERPERFNELLLEFLVISDVGSGRNGRWN